MTPSDEVVIYRDIYPVPLGWDGTFGLDCFRAGPFTDPNQVFFPGQPVIWHVREWRLGFVQVNPYRVVRIESPDILVTAEIRFDDERGRWVRDRILIVPARISDMLF